MQTICFPHSGGKLSSSESSLNVIVIFIIRHTYVYAHFCSMLWRRYIRPNIPTVHFVVLDVEQEGFVTGWNRSAVSSTEFTSSQSELQKYMHVANTFTYQNQCQILRILCCIHSGYVNKCHKL